MNGLIVAKVLIAVAIMALMMGLIAYLILLERKTAAWIQDRIGPNRVGPGGLLQPLVDGAKFLLKEEFIPRNADKILFILAPCCIFTAAFMGFSVIPWGGVLKEGASVLGWWKFPENFPFMVSNTHVGVLVAVAAAGLATYGVVLGGWASGSKFSFLGALRATAQMLSYEVPMAAVANGGAADGGDAESGNHGGVADGVFFGVHSQVEHFCTPGGGDHFYGGDICRVQPHAV